MYLQGIRDQLRLNVALCATYRLTVLTWFRFRHEYSPSPVVSSQSHLIPDPIHITRDYSWLAYWIRDQFWCGSKYFYHRYLSRFLYRSDPRSLDYWWIRDSAIELTAIRDQFWPLVIWSNLKVLHNQKLSQLIWVFNSVISKREYLQYIIGQLINKIFILIKCK